jgi:hypothetical protein
MPERVLRQFGYIQTVPRHPHESAPPQVTLVDITYRFQHFLDHVLTPQQLCHCALQGVEAEEGYIRWFYPVSHPRMILPLEDVQVPRPLEQQALDEVDVEEDGDQGYSELSETLTCIRDRVYAVMYSGVVPQGSEAWKHLEEVLREVYGGKFYHPRHNVQGGRGNRGIVIG